MARGAALILAYRYAVGLAALARYFDTIGIELFVHVDAKANEEAFRDAAKGAARPVRFVERRRNVFWRGFSMVEATIDLMQMALQGPYQRFMLLSDDSAPLVPPSDILDTFDLGYEYLSAHPVGHPDFLRRYSGFYMFDSAATAARGYSLAEREVTADAVARFKRLGTLLERGKKPLPHLYHGSQWWSLTRNSIETVIDSYERDDWMRESFEFSEVPDEQYIQTILGLANPQRTSRTFVVTEWNTPHPPRVYKTAEEIRAPRGHTPEALFIRKVDLPAADLSRYIGSLTDRPQPAVGPA